ncbi:hypothetical protein ACFXPY_44100 [Streptomyces sp. NPDC059153]|uniref:hypothetical protein n=1 Tax=Streptomyces sp. NPDC059153 TaxID=3346743 RepID=UPI00368E7275
MTVIRAPHGTSEALRWAAEEIVDQCGPPGAASAVLLSWLQMEAGDENRMGFQSCALKRDEEEGLIRLEAHFGQWESLAVPVAEVRRMLIDMMQFVTTESRGPLPGWRIHRLGAESWSQRRLSREA